MWRGTAGGIAGRSVYSRGEWIYTDQAFDDHGAAAHAYLTDYEDSVYPGATALSLALAGAKVRVTIALDGHPYGTATLGTATVAVPPGTHVITLMRTGPAADVAESPLVPTLPLLAAGPVLLWRRRRRLS
ncbi:MAG: hypothetical protein ACYDAC_12190 [Candidatus Dormibacteria bacterium]